MKYEYIDNNKKIDIMVCSRNKEDMKNMFSLYKGNFNYSILYSENDKFIFSKFTNILIDKTLENGKGEYVVHSCNKAFLFSLNIYKKLDLIKDNYYYVGHTAEKGINTFSISKGNIEYLLYGFKLKSPIYHFKKMLIHNNKFRSVMGKTYKNVMPLVIMTKNTLRENEYRYNESFVNGLEDNYLSFILRDKIKEIDILYSHTSLTSFSLLKHSKNNNYGSDKELKNNLKVFSDGIDKENNTLSFRFHKFLYTPTPQFIPENFVIDEKSLSFKFWNSFNNLIFGQNEKMSKKRVISYELLVSLSIGIMIGIVFVLMV